MLVRRLVVNKTAEILFNDAIEHLGLPVALGMISCAHAQLGPTLFEKLPPEFLRKMGSRSEIKL